MSLTSEIKNNLSTGSVKGYRKANNKKINAYKKAANDYIDTQTALVEQQNNQLEDVTQSQIEGTRQQYQKSYDYNAINSELQQRQVSERMANMGLSDSGLNMTNQTAIAVSRINGDNALTQQYNNAVAVLRSNLQSAIKENNRALISDVAGIRKSTAENVANIKADTAMKRYEVNTELKSNAQTVRQALVSSVASETDKSKNAQTIYSAAKTYGLSDKSIKKLLSYANISWKDYQSWINNRNFFPDASVATLSSKTNTGDKGKKIVKSNGSTTYDTHGYTTEQIKSIQKQAGIEVDGIWGPNTQSAYEKGFRPKNNKSNEKIYDATYQKNVNAKFLKKMNIHSEKNHDAVMRATYGSYKQYLAEMIETSGLSYNEQQALVIYYGISDSDTNYKPKKEVSQPTTQKYTPPSNIHYSPYNINYFPPAPKR